MSRSTVSLARSETAIPADSWPRCWSAKRPKYVLRPLRAPAPRPGVGPESPSPPGEADECSGTWASWRQVFSEEKLQALQGHPSAHCGYSTTGCGRGCEQERAADHLTRPGADGRAGSQWEPHEHDGAPAGARRPGGQARLHLGHRGDRGADRRTTSGRSRKRSPRRCGASQGAFSAVLLAEGKLVGFRDPAGYPAARARPAGRRSRARVRDSALDLLGADFVREIGARRARGRRRAGHAGDQSDRGRERRRALHLRVHLLRAARLHDARSRAARRPHPDG